MSRPAWEPAPGPATIAITRPQGRSTPSPLSRPWQIKPAASQDVTRGRCGPGEQRGRQGPYHDPWPTVAQAPARWPTSNAITTGAEPCNRQRLPQHQLRHPGTCRPADPPGAAACHRRRAGPAIIYNTSAYDSPDSLALMEGIVDPKGREISSFIDGFAPPHNGFEFTEEGVRAGARLVRAVHDLTAGTEFAAGSEVACHPNLS